MQNPNNEKPEGYDQFLESAGAKYDSMKSEDLVMNDKQKTFKEMTKEIPAYDVNTTHEYKQQEPYIIADVFKNSEFLKPNEIAAVVKMVKDLDISLNEVLEHNMSYTDLVKRWASVELVKLREEKAVKQSAEEERQLGFGLLSTMIDEDETQDAGRFERRTNELVSAMADLEKFELAMGYTTKEELKQEAAIAAARDVVTSAALGQYKMPDFGESRKPIPMNRAERRAAARANKKRGH